jgi:hypothetical protein
VATRTVVTTTCDMPHQNATETPAATFELYSRVAGKYEVDLCEGCAAKIFAPAVANGRKVPTTRRK